MKTIFLHQKGKKDFEKTKHAKQSPKTLTWRFASVISFQCIFNVFSDPFQWIGMSFLMSCLHSKSDKVNHKRGAQVVESSQPYFAWKRDIFYPITWTMFRMARAYRNGNLGAAFFLAKVASGSGWTWNWALELRPSCFDKRLSAPRWIHRDTLHRYRLPRRCHDDIANVHHRFQQRVNEEEVLYIFYI